MFFEYTFPPIYLVRVTGGGEQKLVIEDVLNILYPHQDVLKDKLTKVTQKGVEITEIKGLHTIDSYSIPYLLSEFDDCEDEELRKNLEEWLNAIPLFYLEHGLGDIGAAIPAAARVLVGIRDYYINPNKYGYKKKKLSEWLEKYIGLPFWLRAGLSVKISNHISYVYKAFTGRKPTKEFEEGNNQSSINLYEPLYYPFIEATLIFYLVLIKSDPQEIAWFDEKVERCYLKSPNTDTEKGACADRVRVEALLSSGITSNPRIIKNVWSVKQSEYPIAYLYLSEIVEEIKKRWDNNN